MFKAILFNMLYIKLILFSFLIALSLSLSLNISNKCSKGWHNMNDNCYKLLEDKMNYSTGEQLCSSMRGTLLVIKSGPENDLVKNLLFYQWDKQEDIWLDATMVDPKDLNKGWIWSNSEMVNYFNWGPNQPNQRLGLQNCLEINKEYKDYWGWKAGVWNDIDCSEIDPATANPATDKSTTDNLATNNPPSSIPLSNTMLSLLPLTVLISMILWKYLWRNWKLKCKCIKPPKPFSQVFLL